MAGRGLAFPTVRCAKNGALMFAVEMLRER